MIRYIAIDPGKYATKVAVYDENTNTTSNFRFRTKIGEGNFTDDALEGNTFIAEYNGKVYKVGNGAQMKANLETSKRSEIHKICTLAALAICASDNEVDEFHVAIGIPIKEYGIVEKRNEYKNYILPDGEVEVKLKKKSEDDIITRKFRILSKSVYPESAGVLYLDMLKFKDITAVVDIGSLNINATYWQNFELVNEYSLTDELGSSIITAGLSEALTTEFSRCDEFYVERLLRLPYEQRMLVPTNGNEEIQKRSKQLIDEYLLNHVKEIRRRCDSKHWSLDFVELAFIGGAANILRKEILQVFGENVFIPEEPDYANVRGFLRRLCAKKLGKTIPAPGKENDKTE